MQNKSPTRHLQASLRASACVVIITVQTKSLRGVTHAYRKQSEANYAMSSLHFLREEK
jgi:hypothetical protein